MSGHNTPRLNSPDSVHKMFEGLLNEGNLDRILQIYEPGAVVVDRDGKLVSGSKAIGEYLRGLLALKPKMQITRLHKIEAGDVVILMSDWQMTGRAPDGSTVTDSGHTYDIVRRQKDGTWKVVVDNPYGVTASTRIGSSESKGPVA